MNRRRAMIIATAVFIASLLAVIGVYAYTSWTRTMSWTGIETEEFSVWTSASGGTEITTGGTEALGTVMSPLIREFYIQNDGTVPIVVSVTNEVSTGCTASWSNGGSYSIAVGTSRVLANLTLTTAGAGSYTWEFVVS